MEGVEDVEHGEREEEQEDEAEEGGRRALLAASSGGRLHCPRRFRPSLCSRGIGIFLLVGFVVDGGKSCRWQRADSCGRREKRVRFRWRGRRCERSAGCAFSSRIGGSGSGSASRLRLFVVRYAMLLRGSEHEWRSHNRIPATNAPKNRVHVEWLQA